MKSTLRNRIAATAVGAAAVAGIALAGTGVANAGTVPVTHPGEPSVAMTITNHTDRYEWLVGQDAGTGSWVNGPQRVLAPGASETVVATAPNTSYLTANVAYKVGAFGPTANYEIEDMQGNTNTAMSGMSGPGAQQYSIASNIQSWYPTVNVSYDQW